MNQEYLVECLIDSNIGALPQTRWLSIAGKRTNNIKLFSDIKVSYLPNFFGKTYVNSPPEMYLSSKTIYCRILSLTHPTSASGRLPSLRVEWGKASTASLG